MKTKKPKMAKWKVYVAIVALMSLVSVGFTTLSNFAAFPTSEHRDISRQLNKLNEDTLKNPESYDSIVQSDEYKALLHDKYTVYSDRMTIGGSVLSFIITVAMIVAVYRYLRRTRVTAKPVGATVLLNVASTAVIAVPSIYIGQALTGITMGPLMMVMLIIASPFVLLFTALFSFVVAKITEWHYNRSHGFIEE